MSIEKEDKGVSPVVTQLKALDEQIKAASGGGLYELLATLAEQTYGLQRSAFSAPKPEPSSKAETPPEPSKAAKEEPPDPKHGHAVAKDANAQRK